MTHAARPGRAWMAVPALAAGVLLLAGSPAFAADTAPVYNVTQEGMTSDDGAKLADAFGIPNSVQSNGAFAYTSAAFGAVPHKTVGEGKDEAGRPVVSQAMDVDALKSMKVLPDAAAARAGAKLISLVGLSPDLKADPSVSHTDLTLSDAKGTPTDSFPIDTAVSYKLTLGGLPLTGQGAKLRIAFAGDGSVTQLRSSLRKLERGRNVPIISVDDAAKQCAALYADDVRQGTPTLGYQMPDLAATDASGKGPVQQILPVYTCNPSAATGPQANRLLPAIQGAAPTAVLRASLNGTSVSAAVASVSGGAAPYSFEWSSSTTALDPNTGPKIAYTRAPRDGKLDGEVVTLEVTDANGITATASATLAGDGSYSATTVPGGGGFGKLAIGPVDVGIEQTVDEWQCAQDSAIGFKNSMASHGVNTAFDFRGTNAWEQDFKKVSAGGDDVTYADNVDAQWYTGHGNPNGFTFKNTTHDDGSIVPGDADWGNGDLEWLQLESCNVLEDTNGTHNYFSRWGGTINGLHMLNGFDTTAECVGGGTGGTFADYLFPWKIFGITIRPALTVRQAWGQMAIDKEPSGTKYRSMGNIASNGVTNIGDFFWGQGTTGPDIAKAGRSGMWAISGTV
jgi:hypothetical protein